MNRSSECPEFVLRHVGSDMSAQAASDVAWAAEAYFFLPRTESFTKKQAFARIADLRARYWNERQSTRLSASKVRQYGSFQGLSASEANEFLRTLPPFGGDA